MREGEGRRLGSQGYAWWLPAWPLIEALELLKRYANSSQRLYPAREQVPLRGVVPPAIEELVVCSDAKGKQRVDRINYEIGFLRELTLTHGSL